MNKHTRQAHITQLINQQIITTQDELLNALHQTGIKATQATISRDIRELKIVKAQDAKGQIRYTIFKHDERTLAQKVKDTLTDVGVSIVQIEFINIIKTLPSNGNLLAALIDDLADERISGSVAGNDTIVLFSKTPQEAKRLYDDFQLSLIKNN